MSTPAQAAQARYRQRRRESIGVDVDRARSRAATNKSTAKHRGEINERRRAREARKTAALQRLEGDNTDRVAAGISTVTAKALRFDLTRWVGPGWRIERQLESAANLILASAGQRPLKPA